MLVSVLTIVLLSATRQYLLVACVSVNTFPSHVHASITRTVVPTVEPVTLAEMKLALRVNHDADDARITDDITAAREYVESRTRRALNTQTWVLRFDRWPGEQFALPRPPLISVTTVQYVDVNGSTQTAASSLYLVDTASDPGRIALDPDNVWPTEDTRINAIIVTYTAGYGATAASVPLDLKKAVMMRTAWLYRPPPAGDDDGWRRSFKDLIGPYIVAEMP